MAPNSNVQLEAESDGGAISFYFDPQKSFLLTIENSTFWENTASRHSGAIAIFDTGGIPPVQPRISITNTTIVNNIIDSNGDQTGHGGVYCPMAGSPLKIQ